jgi:Ni,Fe-hydrogenase III small subunit
MGGKEGVIASSLEPDDATGPNPAGARSKPFLRSLHVREVSTGDSASDFEATAACNAQFDVGRYGVHFVASPRYADALLVSGPVGRAMKEPLRRCYDAMAEPRMVIALGCSAIGGGVFAGGYAEANGVSDVLPVDCFIPGDPPHPWSVVHGLLLAMGRLD